MQNQNIRTKLVSIFKDTIEMIGDSEKLRNAVANANETVLYLEGETPTFEHGDCKTTYDVTKHRSFEAAGLLKKQFPGSKICVLNFASATNPGGGVEFGSRAQEESLCRCSTLFPYLSRRELRDRYYKIHDKVKNPLYTDGCIYTPNIYVIKSDTDFPERLPESEWFAVDVLTCAAPNLRLVDSFPDEELYKLHVKRIRHILSIAAANKEEILVLGAFGCGAFKNNPKVVAKAFKDVLKEFEGCFKHIEFAIYCNSRETENFDAFEREFA